MKERLKEIFTKKPKLLPKVKITVYPQEKNQINKNSDSNSLLPNKDKEEKDNSHNITVQNNPIFSSKKISESNSKKEEQTESCYNNVPSISKKDNPYNVSISKLSTQNFFASRSKPDINTSPSSLNIQQTTSFMKTDEDKLEALLNKGEKSREYSNGITYSSLNKT